MLSLGLLLRYWFISRQFRVPWRRLTTIDLERFLCPLAPLRLPGNFALNLQFRRGCWFLPSLLRRLTGFSFCLGHSTGRCRHNYNLSLRLGHFLRGNFDADHFLWGSLLGLPLPVKVLLWSFQRERALPLMSAYRYLSVRVL